MRAAVAVFALGAALTAGGASAAPASFTWPTAQGPVEVVALGHASLMLRFAGQVIHVDPWSRVADYATLPKADQIWITHEHADHLDLEAIRAVSTESTRVIADGRSAARLGAYGPRLTVLTNGQQARPGGVLVEAVAAYNLVRERQPGVKYHPKGWYNGYVATLGDQRIYIAGDTECIPEMGQLGRIDLAFLPINLPFTMPPEEAVGCIKVIAPRAVVPYHQGDSDPAVVARALEGSGIRVMVFPLP